MPWLEHVNPNEKEDAEECSVQNAEQDCIKASVRSADIAVEGKRLNPCGYCEMCRECNK